ncbi:RsfA family transcriptional regulator [Neobacillus notoginsengisoli]|uniref:RsfA family transcriptional regulator n=1 Tax=Neobacillus notoginsengisoli TaxID=1578198 RepID=A0A417YR01_9BACI|nr:RsfA family transcriptional regulator [Neobacillus notoginsengisoli]RHW36514.1 RsfA family transcriptional regulator [Neobacillus notoginsengisoli]
MSSTRQDAWTADEDLLLAEVILRHIREGGTQLQAFEEVGRQLSRTSAACGFRWNSHVRKQYKSGIEHAKKQRKEGKKAGKQILKDTAGQEPQVAETPSLPQAKPEIELDVVLNYIEKLYRVAGRAATNEDEQKQLRERVKELEKENNSLAIELTGLREDYQALINILNKARKMASEKEEESLGQQKAKFQIDKYGNLERVE